MTKEITLKDNLDKYPFIRRAMHHKDCNICQNHVLTLLPLKYADPEDNKIFGLAHSNLIRHLKAKHPLSWNKEN
jgi:hypothetical protein